MILEGVPMAICSRFRLKEMFSLQNSKPIKRLAPMLRSIIQDGGALADLLFL